MGRISLILLLCPLISFSQMADDTKHKLAGHATSLTVGHAVYYKTQKLGLSITAAFISGVLIGIAKEELDLYTDGVSTKQDVYDTSWGSAVGTVNFLMTFNINKGSRKKNKKKLDYYQH